MSTVKLSVVVDTITPKLRALQKLGRDTTPVMRAMGTTFKSITEGNFNSAGAQFRAAAWSAKKDGTPSNLKKSGLLWHSFHLDVTKDRATLANPTPYAAVHQFGSDKSKGRGSGIPARPFYPVLNGKLTAAAQEKIAAAGMRAVEKIAG